MVENFIEVILANEKFQRQILNKEKLGTCCEIISCGLIKSELHIGCELSPDDFDSSGDLILEDGSKVENKAQAPFLSRGVLTFNIAHKEKMFNCAFCTIMIMAPHKDYGQMHYQHFEQRGNIYAIRPSDEPYKINGNAFEIPLSVFTENNLIHSLTKQEFDFCQQFVTKA